MGNKLGNIVILGGVAAGPKAAAKVRRQDSKINITLLTEED